MVEVRVFLNGLFRRITGFIESDAVSCIGIKYIAILNPAESYVLRSLIGRLVNFPSAVVSNEVLVYVIRVKERLVSRQTLVADIISVYFMNGLLYRCF